MQISNEEWADPYLSEAEERNWARKQMAGDASNPDRSWWRNQNGTVNDGETLYRRWREDEVDLIQDGSMI